MLISIQFKNITLIIKIYINSKIIHLDMLFLIPINNENLIKLSYLVIYF